MRNFLASQRRFRRRTVRFVEDFHIRESVIGLHRSRSSSHSIESGGGGLIILALDNNVRDRCTDRFSVDGPAMLLKTEAVDFVGAKGWKGRCR